MEKQFIRLHVDAEKREVSYGRLVFREKLLLRQRGVILDFGDEHIPFYLKLIGDNLVVSDSPDFIAPYDRISMDKSCNYQLPLITY